MCGPFAIPLALMAAGSVAKFFGEQQAAHAKVATFNNERNRQMAFDAQQTDAFKDSLAKTQEMQGADAVNKAADAREGTLASAIVPGAATTGSYLPGSSSAPSVVNTAQDVADKGSEAKSRGLAHALAALGGSNDQFQQLGTAYGRNSDQISQLGSFKSGSMGVLPAEMDAAAAKGGFLRGIGGLAQTIGSAWLGGSAALGAGGTAASAGSKVGSILEKASAVPKGAL